MMEHYELRPGAPFESYTRPHPFESSTNMALDNTPTARSSLFDYSTRETPSLGRPRRRKPFDHNTFLPFPHDFHEAQERRPRKRKHILHTPNIAQASTSASPQSSRSYRQVIHHFYHNNRLYIIGRNKCSYELPRRLSRPTCICVCALTWLYCSISGSQHIWVATTWRSRLESGNEGRRRCLTRRKFRLILGAVMHAHLG